MKVFIDLGAFTGDTIEIALKRYQDFDKFYGFEPFSKNFETLKNTFGSSDNVVLYQAAASLTSGKEKLYLQKNLHVYPDTGHTLLAQKRDVQEDRYETVDTIDFSKFITDNFDISDQIILKIDIEGMEYDLLSKMIQDDSIKYINQIFCEWHPTRAKIGKKRHRKMIHQLNRMGYNLSGTNRRDEFSQVMHKSVGHHFGKTVNKVIKFVFGKKL